MSEYERPDDNEIAQFCDIMCTGLLHFIPSGHALVIEYEGEKFDICNSDGELSYFPCKYDTAPGTIVECVLVDTDEEIDSYDQVSEMTRALHGELDKEASPMDLFRSLLGKMSKN